MSFLLASFLLLFSLTALGCEVSIPEQFSLATSPQNQLFFSYKADGTNNSIPVIRAFNCTKLAMTNKFLMIAFGPQNQEFTDRVGIFDFTNDYRDSGCSIGQSPFKRKQTFVDRKNYLDQKWNALKACYRISVTEESNTSLDMPIKQPGCQYERHGTNEMSFNGGFCFVKPNFSSSYLIRFSLKDECLSYEGLNKLNVTVTDFQSMLNFYSAGNATGNSVDLTAINTFPLRLSVTPFDKLINPSEDYGILTPQFPAPFALPDLHMGSPEAKQTTPDRIQIRLPYWADNNCKKKCAGLRCQSLCDYAQPIVGNVEYFELDNQNHVTFLSSWFEGGIAQPHYQGEISGVSYELTKEVFEIGKTYRINVHFNDPKFDFERFKNRVKKNIGHIDQTLGSLGRSTIRTVPETPPLGEIARVPSFPAITGLNFGHRLYESLEQAVETLTNYLSFKVWPPYFEKICLDDTCKAIKDDYLMLGLDFQVIGLDPVTKEFQLKILRISRDSELLEKYEKFNPTMPKIVCPY